MFEKLLIKIFSVVWKKRLINYNLSSFEGTKTVTIYKDIGAMIKEICLDPDTSTNPYIVYDKVIKVKGWRTAIIENPFGTERKTVTFLLWKK